MWAQLGWVPQAHAAHGGPRQPSMAGGGSQLINGLKKFKTDRKVAQVYKTVFLFIYSHRAAAHQFDLVYKGYHPGIPQRAKSNGMLLSLLD